MNRVFGIIWREKTYLGGYMFILIGIFISILYELKNELNSKDEKELQDQNEDFYVLN